MRIFSILLIVLLSSITIVAQDITGQWNGVLKVQGTQLRVVFNVTADNGELKSTMDSPDQGAKGIPTTATTFENSTLKITIINAGIEYTGTLGDDNIIVGTFKQAGQSFPMNLTRGAIEKEAIDYILAYIRSANKGKVERKARFRVMECDYNIEKLLEAMEV